MKRTLTVAACVCMLAGCGTAQQKQPSADPAETVLKEKYSTKELLKLSGYRSSAVELPKHVSTPKISSRPTELSIRLKAEHLLTNKGIDLKKRRMTEADARKAGYSSLASLKKEAGRILIKQNRELRPVLASTMICSEAFSKAKISVTEKDRKAYRKVALLQDHAGLKKSAEKGDKETEISDEGVRKMLFCSAVIAKEKTALSEKDVRGGGSSAFSSYSGIYRNRAAGAAAEKALVSYCRKIVKK